jgi:hypothetical protein
MSFSVGSSNATNEQDSKLFSCPASAGGAVNIFNGTIMSLTATTATINMTVNSGTSNNNYNLYLEFES